MAYQRDFAILLRVFEPLVVHPELADYPVSENRETIAGLVAADADTRLISIPPDPVADSYRGTPIFMPAADGGDEFDRVCPVQDDIRSWHALEALAERGVATLRVCSLSEEHTALAARADVLVRGSEGVLRLLRRLTDDVRRR